MNYQDFVNKNYVYLVVGVSQDRSKWGYRVWKTLSAYGYRAVPVNPKYEVIDGTKCYPSIRDTIYDLRFTINIQSVVVVTVVPPSVTVSIVREAVALGITNIWMQEGSRAELENQETKEPRNVKTVKNKCIIRDGLGKPFTV